MRVMKEGVKRKRSPTEREAPSMRFSTTRRAVPSEMIRRAASCEITVETVLRARATAWVPLWNCGMAPT